MQMSTPSEPTPARTVKPRRARRAARVILPSVAAAAVTALGFAAFTDDAANNGNRASAANVVLTEDVPATTPLFDLDNWQPHEEDTVSRCISVTNDGSIPLPVGLRLKGTPSGDLADYVDMKIEVGSRAKSVDTSDCATFKADPAVATVFEAELDEFPTAAGAAISDKAGKLAVDAERTYRVTWHLQDDEAAEGKSVAGVNFLWETTSAD